MLTVHGNTKFPVPMWVRLSVPGLTQHQSQFETGKTKQEALRFFCCVLYNTVSYFVIDSSLMHRC